MILYSVCTVVQKLILKDGNKNPIAFSILFQIVVGILIGIYAFSINSLAIPNLAPILFSFGLMIVLWVFNNAFLYKALKLIDASKFSIVYSSRAFFAIFASSLLLKQSLSLSGYIGTFFIITGIIVVSIKSRKFEFNKGDIFSILAAIGFGFELTNDKFLLGFFNAYTYGAIVFLIPGFFLWILFPNVTREMRYYFQKNSIAQFMLACLLMAVSIILTYSALKLTSNSSQFASISLLSVVIVVILSTIFLKERDSLLQKVIGTILSVIGLMLVASQL